MFNTLTRMSVSLVQKYLPSPFVFSALLTLGVLLAGILSTCQSLPAMVQHWSGGFWTLLGFAMQMALIFVTGHALASAPIINRQLDRLAGMARTPGQAIILVTLVALVGCWVNWGFGLVIGAVFARALARKVDGVDYPLLAFLSAGVVNVFVPSGGGQWAVQGPIMLPAAQALGVSPTVTAMAIAWGDAWTNMIQPFWALPLLGIVGLGARDIMGYCLIMLLYSGIVISGAFYFLG